MLFFINYEKLNSKIMWKDIFKKLDLRYYYKKNFFKISNTTNIPHFDKDLYKKSRKIYEKLLTLVEVLITSPTRTDMKQSSTDFVSVAFDCKYLI